MKTLKNLERYSAAARLIEAQAQTSQLLEDMPDNEWKERVSSINSILLSALKALDRTPHKEHKQMDPTKP